MLVDRNAAAVVFDGNRGTVGVQRDANVRGIAVHRLVDGVVEHLPHQVMQPRRTDAPDIHTRALANRLEPFQDGNVFRGVVGGAHV
jgi:hypothetical protein